MGGPAQEYLMRQMENPHCLLLRTQQPFWVRQLQSVGLFLTWQDTDIP